MNTRAFIIAFTIGSSLSLSVGVKAVELCHIANAGFLVKGDQSSVLIDGLMIDDQYEGRFALPSEAMQKQMMDKTGLFNNLSVVVSTHKHGDHFDPKATVAHIRATKDVNYVLPADTKEALSANGLQLSEMSRIKFAIDGQQSRYQLGDVIVEVYDIDHGPNMPQNNGYRITVDGKTFFHTGDINTSREQLSDSGMNALEVDVLMIPFWYGLNDDEQRGTLEASWSYKHIVPTHFQATPAPWMEQFGGFDGLKQTVVKAYAHAYLIANEGECLPIE